MLDLRYERMLVAWQGYFGQKVWKYRLVLPTFWKEFLGKQSETAEDFIICVYTLPVRVQEFLGWEKIEQIESALSNLKQDVQPYIGNDMERKYPWWKEIKY